MVVFPAVPNRPLDMFRKDARIEMNGPEGLLQLITSPMLGDICWIYNSAEFGIGPKAIPDETTILNSPPTFVAPQMSRTDVTVNIRKTNSN